MTQSRRGFLSRLFGGAAVALVPPSWYLRQGLPAPVSQGLPAPVSQAPACSGVLSPAQLNAKFVACAEHIDSFLAAREKRPSVWKGRISIPYDPKTFQFTV